MCPTQPQTPTSHHTPALHGATKYSLLVRAGLVVSLVLGLWLPTAGLAAPAHYLVLETAGATVEPLFYQRVELAQEPTGASDAKLLGARSREAAGQPMVWVELLDQDSGVVNDKALGETVVYRDAVVLRSTLRGEFHGDAHGHEHAPIDGFSVSGEASVFVLRLPVVDGTTLKLAGRSTDGANVTAELDLADLAARAESLPLAAFARQAKRSQGALQPKNQGSSANRADFLILGDGYTAAQRNRFEADANRLQNQMFGITPYREYRSYAKVSRVFVASAQSGADHPPFQSGCNDASCCSDTDAQGDPRSGTFVDTALDATFCTANIQRLLTVNLGKTFAAAAAAPNWDQILVLVNDPVYGGSGGTLAVGSLNTAAVEVMQHEIGHSFTLLADEYETANPGTQPCGEVFGNCEANVTDRSQRPQIKWRPWIQASTPVPTPGNPGFADAVGVFEGARYQTAGQYRPKLDCQMRSLGAPFCEVCTQEYILRLFNGGFGVPAGGIDPIEPGSESPAPGNVDAGSEALTLSVDLLQPSAGRPLTVSWRVDGETVPGATGPTLLFEPERSGTYTVELVVDAVTPLVNPQMAGDALLSSRRWTVTSDGVRPALEARFAWQGSQVDEAIVFSDLSPGEPESWLWEFGDGVSSTEASPTYAFTDPGIYPVRLTVGREGETATTVRSVRVYDSEAGPCVAANTNLCLNTEGRFRVESLWRDPAGGTGAGQVVPFGSLDSGLFQFFGADNWELLLKVIDGCGFNDHYWLFAAATTNVEYALRVTDTLNGSVKEYLNPAGNSSPAITDIEAFATCEAEAPTTVAESTLVSTEPQTPSARTTVAPGIPCADDAQHLCLLDDQFEISIDWRDHAGNTGSASRTPAQSDNSGTLWFFNANNWEVLLKVIDGCALNDRFWVFAAASTDVETTLRMRHVASGEVVEYFNPLGRVSPPITDTEALAVCSSGGGG